jgi:hypothetical protein
MIGHIPDNEPFYEIAWFHYVRQSHKYKLVRVGVVIGGNRGRVQQEVQFHGQVAVEI